MSRSTDPAREVNPTVELQLTGFPEESTSPSPEASPSASAFSTTTVLLIINVVSATVVATILLLTPPASVTSKYPRSSLSTSLVALGASVVGASNTFTGLPFLS